MRAVELNDFKAVKPKSMFAPEPILEACLPENSWQSFSMKSRTKSNRS